MPLLKIALVLGLAVLGERMVRPSLRGWTPPDLENFRAIVVATGLTLLLGTVINNTFVMGAALP